MVEISKIVEQNPWWKGREFEFEKYDEYLRAYEDSAFKIKRAFPPFKHNNIYSISGPRQAGKTTLIKLLVKNLIRIEKEDPLAICYFSCDSLLSRSRKELRKVIDFFFEKLRRFEKGYILLDEVSYVQDWPFEIKSFVDEGKLKKIALFLTGSPLGVKEVEFLPGRHIEGNRYFLKPLSFREFIKNLDNKSISFLSSDPEVKHSIKLLKEKLNKNFLTLEEEFKDVEEKIEDFLPFKDTLDFLLDFFIKVGGFPKPIEEYIKNKKVEERSYETIINVIMSDLLKRGKSEEVAKQIFSGVIKRLGSSYDFRTLVKDTVEGIAVNTIIDYLKIFEDSFLIKILYSYDFERKRRRIKGNKKIYFADPFILYSIYSWLEGKNGFEVTEDILKHEENVSTILESIVFSSLSSVKEAPLINPSLNFLWFYYDKRGEIDFIFKRASDFLGIEVKYKPEVEEKIIKLNQVKAYIILSKDSFKIKDNVIIVPASLFLALIEKSKHHL